MPSYSSAQYPTSTPAAQAQSAANARQSQSRSPQQSLSPVAGGTGAFQQPTSQQPTPPSKYPMAAPPLPQTPSAPAVASPQTPLSPATQTREQQRVALLLDINVDLLQEVNRLQSEGKGGALSAQQQTQLKSQGLPDTLASEEYIQCLRRVQGNLAYMGNMAPRAQPDASKMLPGPAFMTPPPHLSSRLGPKYERLKELFPGWPGHIQKLATQTTHG
ncbi:MAG: hypothetical protein INR71_05240, partial [Terriglobus roseus]|nr:hypothetical protein [Terriglobus roseus]